MSYYYYSYFEYYEIEVNKLPKVTSKRVVDKWFQPRQSGLQILTLNTTFIEKIVILLSPEAVAHIVLSW